MHSSDDVSLCPGSGIFKMFTVNMLFCAIIGTGKKNSLKQFLLSVRAKRCFYAVIAIQHAFLMHFNICWAPREVLNPRLSGTGFNTSLGAQRMLMHSKSCLIPILILTYEQENTDTWIWDLGKGAKSVGHKYRYTSLEYETERPL